jgi:hypothetical protein
MSTDTLGYQDTPILPDSGFHVHDGLRPQPPVVTPGEGTTAPSDAIVLFDGTNLDAWETLDGAPAGWKIENGYMEVMPKTGNIRTKQSFSSIQLHLEFASPTVVKGDGQGRGNSGVFLQSLYEMQVLDNYDNPTYPDGTVGGIYGQYPPLVNASRKPGEWNTYDIIWEAPKFDGDTVVRPAFVTVILNNLLLQHRKQLLGKTDHKVAPEYIPHADAAPLMLQDHGDLVRFRNIWLRKIEISG